MKKIKHFICVFVLLCTLFQSSIPLDLASNPVMISSKPSSDYEDHATISINGDGELDTQAGNEGWSGDGTSSNPYYIENYRITSTGTDLINIANTDKFLVISNCYLSTNNTSHYPIYLTNVGNITIRGNTIIDTGFEIFMVGFNAYITIENNVFSNSGGIKTVGGGGSGSNISIHGNYFESVIGSSAATISVGMNYDYCSVYDNVIDGCETDYCISFNSPNGHIWGNNILTDTAGIFLGTLADNTSVNDNIITIISENCYIADPYSYIDIPYIGIEAECSDSIITFNTIQSSWTFGFKVGGDNNTFRYNTLLDNNKAFGASYVYDEGLYNKIEYNFYGTPSTDQHLEDSFYYTYYFANPSEDINRVGYDPRALIYPVYNQISIGQNFDFFFNYDFPGIGTINDPFRIEDLSICSTKSSDTLLSIANTDYYFVVENCFFYGENTLTGMEFSNINSAIISNCYIENVTTGMMFDHCSNFQVLNSRMQVINDSAIVLDYSSYNTFRNNFIFDSGNEAISIGHDCNSNGFYDSTISHVNSTGIYENYYSKRNVYRGNTITNATRGIVIDGNSSEITMNVISDILLEGIYISPDSNGLFIKENDVYSCDSGIVINSSQNVQIRINRLSNNNQHGVYLYNSDNILVTKNSFESNSEEGISINSTSNDNRITWNDFVFNNGGDDQAFEDGNGGNNLYQNNFWSDLIGPDNDGDGIVDVVYNISGVTGLNDTTPRTGMNNLPYQQLGEISVSGNSQFAAFATLHGLQGNGTRVNPYIIENWYFMNYTETTISISNTDVYFKIQESLFYQAQNCISLNGVKHGEITDNMILRSPWTTTISLVDCDDIIIQDNQIDMGYTKSNIGLTVDNSFDIMIKSNSLRNFKQGINITSSHSLIVQDNFIDHCETGMKLFNVSSSIFTGNKLQNGYTGIDGQDIHDSMLTENQLLDMDNAGITVQVTMNVTISNSFFDCCANVGIVVSNSNDLKLKMNTVLTSRIGISILSCNSSFIAANQLEDNLNGIYIGLSNEHSVFVIFNRIYRSCNNGIFITGNPGTNATIAGNLIQDSHEYGFLSQGFVESQVFHNNFILTKRNEYDYQKQAQSMSEASFYYNYWSDHPDIDTDHDGIVDSSYDVEGPTSDSTPMADLVPQVLVTAEINFSSYGFKGTGSSGDPYQVNDLHFYSKDTALLVVKAGTTNYLEITDCYFEGKNRLFDGIQITTDNVNIKSVHGCQFERLDHGIFAYDLDSTDISGNTFLDNNHGVFIDQATDLTLEDNVFIKNDCGMEIYNLDTGTIQNNGFTDSERTGLRLKTLINGNITDNIFRNNSIGLYIINSTDIVVTENIFTSNVVIGLNIESSYILTIQENVIMSNLNYGIQMIKSNTTDILNNTFLDNENYGMYLVATVSSINVRYNDFINNLFRNKHVFSDGIVNFAYNYWDTWIAPDNDDNGIVDDPYLIPGIAGNYDNTPVTISYHMANAPVIINPNGGETFNGTIMIEWSSVLDKQGHDVSYNLYYSFGNEWITIASNLQATNYTWDTFTVPNSDYCILKVMAICTQNIYTFAVSNNFSILNHVFTPITFVYPALVDEVIMDTVVIDWSDVVDAWNHPVKYDLEVSTDGGMIWSDLATNLTLSEYSWDSTTGNDSLNVLFRVTAHCSEGLEASVPSKVVILHNDLSYPEIINPVAGDTVQGYTTIAWNMSTDSLGMSVEYSIYYSMNGGIIWNLLVANLPQETTTYSWDTTLFDDSTYYLVKIVAATPDGLTREAVMDEVFTVQNDFWVTKTTRITSAPGLELVMALVVLVSVTMRKMYRQKKTRDKICNF